MMEYLNTVIRSRAEFNNRVYPDFAPRTTAYPFAVFQLLSDATEPTLATLQGGQEFLTDIRIYSKTRKEADDLRDAIKRLLDAALNVDLGACTLRGSYLDSFRNTGDPKRSDYLAEATWLADLEENPDTDPNQIQVGGENIQVGGQNIFVS